MTTDAECKSAICPPGKARVRLACSGGLYLEIGTNGSKCWFLKYRKDKNVGRMALGRYTRGAKSSAKATADTAPNTGALPNMPASCAR